MIRPRQGAKETRNRQLKRGLLAILLVALALVAVQPAAAKGGPSFPAASQLCDLQGGVFSAYEGFGYSCSGMNPLAEPAGMGATTPLCERAARGSYLTVAGTYLCLL